MRNKIKNSTLNKKIKDLKEKEKKKKTNRRTEENLLLRLEDSGMHILVYWQLPTSITNDFCLSIHGKELAVL